MSIKNTREAKRLIEAMAPEGEFLAFINEREAQMLRDAGGSGIMTLAGIPSFVDFGPGGPSNPGPSGFGGGGGNQNNDDTYGEDFQGSAFGSNRGDMGPTIDTSGEDYEEDNARMMQALGIPPGITFSGTDNFTGVPQRVPDAKTLGINAALYFLGKNNPKVAAAIQAIRGGKRVLDSFRNPDLGLSLTRNEEKELTTLQRGEDLGLNNAKQSERLEELKEKKAAEEEKK